jgi:hypothetical protein
MSGKQDVKFDPVIKFSGVTYHLYDRYVYQAKYKAQEDAARLRKGGKLVRAVAVKGGYLLYTRSK